MIGERGFWATLIAIACFFLALLSYYATQQDRISEWVGPPPGLGDVIWVTMAQLGDFPVEDVAHSKALLEERIPDTVKELSGKEIVVDGFMLPLTVGADGKVSEFYLFRHMESCCFGGSPLPTDFIHIFMDEGESAWAGHAYEFIRVQGDLDVGVETDQYDTVTSIYRLKASRAKVPDEF